MFVDLVMVAICHPPLQGEGRPRSGRGGVFCAAL